jgi:hypothetical protein
VKLTPEEQATFLMILYCGVTADEAGRLVAGERDPKIVAKAKRNYKRWEKRHLASREEKP